MTITVYLMTKSARCFLLEAANRHRKKVAIFLTPVVQVELHCSIERASYGRCGEKCGVGAFSI